MEAYLHDWLSLLLRWAHFITGVAWIGASFYFNWLENHLERQNAAGGIAGDLWAVHGGGFYHLEKYRTAPEKLPTTLHWFKYEAYFTWITGFALLCSVYYWNAGAFLIDRSVADISTGAGIAISLASMLLSWLVYDLLCRSVPKRNGAILAAAVFAWFVLLAWFLSEFLSGRAAYIHVGAAIGTVMVANVFFVIIPSQKDLVAAVGENRGPNGARAEEPKATRRPWLGKSSEASGTRRVERSFHVVERSRLPPKARAGKRDSLDALMRSRHNNYFTLPVLFIMISNHYGGTFSHPWNWLILALIAIAGVGIRHWFNIRHLPAHNRWVLPLSLLLLAGLIFILKPQEALKKPEAAASPGTAAIMPVITERCTVCHAEKPGYPGINSAPMGIVLEGEQSLEAMAPSVYRSVVLTRSMPLGNLTGMTDEERELVERWYRGAMGSE